MTANEMMELQSELKAWSERERSVEEIARMEAESEEFRIMLTEALSQPPLTPDAELDLAIESWGLYSPEDYEYFYVLAKKLGRYNEVRNLSSALFE